MKETLNLNKRGKGECGEVRRGLGCDRQFACGWVGNVYFGVEIKAVD